jgi:hypothetical protein
MELVSTTLIIIGALISFIFGLQLLITAFQTSILWGLGYLFVPCFSLLFIITYWSGAKKPFLRSLLGGSLMLVGKILAPVG